MRKLHFLVTAGPTREPIDPVRFLSNRSSGKMGYALARAAVAAGYRVTLVSGPVHLSPPLGVRVLRVETADQMRDAVLKETKKSNVILMAAAVADYQPVSRARQKLKKGAFHRALKLKKTVDILLEIGRRKKPGQVLVGFAAETSRLLEHARKKLEAKNLDFVVANRVGRKDSGFESDYNHVTLIARDGRAWSMPRMRKDRLATRLLDIFRSSPERDSSRSLP